MRPRFAATRCEPLARHVGPGRPSLTRRSRRLARWSSAVLGAILLLALTGWVLVTQPAIMDPSPPCSVQPVDAARLWAHVTTIADPDAPRDYTHPANLDAIAGYLRKELEEAGGKVSEQSYRVGTSTYRNVLASFGPDTGERVVVGAHYDTAGEQPGADDNASGVAGLLELAHALGANPPRARVELVAFTLEEPPFFATPQMGSAVHARSLRERGVKVRAMLSLEMIGYFTDAPESQRFPLPLLRYVYPRTGNFIAVVGKLGQWETVRRIKQAMRGASDLPVHSINAPTWVPGVDFSDHLNYWAAGYRAAMITDTAFYRNDRYHTAQDTAASLDYERMAKVVEGVHCAVRVLTS